MCKSVTSLTQGRLPEIRSRNETYMETHSWAWMKKRDGVNWLKYARSHALPKLFAGSFRSVVVAQMQLAHVSWLFTHCLMKLELYHKTDEIPVEIKVNIPLNQYATCHWKLRRPFTNFTANSLSGVYFGTKFALITRSLSRRMHGIDGFILS